MEDEINEDEIFEKKESKIKPILEKISKYKKIIIAICIIIIFAIISIIINIPEKITNLLSINEIGNTAGNILNLGYSVEHDGYIYYVAPSEDRKSTNIYRAHVGTDDYETIYKGDYDIRSLNIVGNKLYFISLSLDDVAEDDEIDNKIYKMDLDGSNIIAINDNEFAYDSTVMYIVKNCIYYVGEDKNVYKMDLNGGNRQLVANTGTGYLTLNDNYIIYNKAKDDEEDYITYIKKLNGPEEQPVNGERIYTPIIDGDFVYYINQNGNLAKTPILGGEEEQVTDFTIYNMNIYNGNIYYLNYKDEASEDYTVCIFKLDLNGGESEIIKELVNYSAFLNIVSDYAYYIDMDEEKAFINLININDLSEIKLEEWKY